MHVDPAFWASRRVLLTGHTGFKGAWLSLWLTRLGARVTGVADGVPTDPSLYELARVGDGLTHVGADIRDPEAVGRAVASAGPEVVIHMAAQPFVRRSFADPRVTYATNVMGTVNVLEAVRTTAPDVAAIVVVTSDKCYDNREQGRPFVEDDPMGGHDPYSSSKGCAELVVDAYRRSFELPLASVRAGNVIGGGDWGEDRLIADFVRAADRGETVRVRNPEAVRPWQHVLDPLSGYLTVAQAVAASRDYAEGWNFGPSTESTRPVRWIAERLTEMWPEPLGWECDEGAHPHEAQFLSLSSEKARDRLGWCPRWDLDQALRRIVEWHSALRSGEDMRAVTLDQIGAFAA